MVLLVGGLKINDVPGDSRSLYSMAPQLKESGVQFANMIPKIVGPKELLYVSQREFAVCHPHDKMISVLGTDDCTTCMAMVLRHSASGAVGVCHLDSVCIEGIKVMVNRLQEVSGGYYDSSPISMHIVGSFSDTRGYSEELISSVLSLMHNHSVEFELVTACVGELNTVVRGNIPWPIFYGMGVNVKTGEIFPATFPDKGPDISLRQARLFSGSYELLEVYDCASGLLRVGPFHYEPMRSAHIFLQESDDFVLNHLSSSPEVEPPHVAQAMRNALRQILEHPFPAITIFPDNRPRYFKKDDQGQWNLIRPEFAQDATV